MLSAARTGEEYFALRMASQAAVKVFGNPLSRPHLPWSNGQTQVESALTFLSMENKTGFYGSWPHLVKQYIDGLFRLIL